MSAAEKNAGILPRIDSLPHEPELFAMIAARPSFVVAFALSLLVQGAQISREGEATLLAFDEFFADF